MRFLFIFSFSCFLLLTQSCAEKVETSRIRTLHLYSDVLDGGDEDLFYYFEKNNKVDVRIHCLPFNELLKRLQKQRYSTNIDMVLLGEPSDFKKLQERNYLFLSKFTDEVWQPLVVDPLVFLFDNDSTQNFTTYGQIARSDNVLLKPSVLLKTSYLNETFKQLEKIYSEVSQSTWQKHIVNQDSIIPKKTEIIRWSFHSELRPEEFRFGLYPDQSFFGALGKSIGLGIIHNCQNLVEAKKLYDWCEKEMWRAKLGRKTNMFPIISQESNKDRYPYVYQNFDYHKN